MEKVEEITEAVKSIKKASTHYIMNHKAHENFERNIIQLPKNVNSKMDDEVGISKLKVVGVIHRTAKASRSSPWEVS